MDNDKYFIRINKKHDAFKRQVQKLGVSPENTLYCCKTGIDGLLYAMGFDYQSMTLSHLPQAV